MSRILKVGYYSYVVPMNTEVGHVIDTLSSLKMVENTYEKGKFAYFEKEAEDISITSGPDKVFNSREEAKASLELSEKDE